MLNIAVQLNFVGAQNNAHFQHKYQYKYLIFVSTDSTTSKLNFESKKFLIWTCYGQ